MFEPDRRHLIAYVAAAAVLVVIAVRLIGQGGGQAPAASVSMAAPPTPHAVGDGAATPAAEPPSIWVDVAGAVRRPGLYKLPAGSRVAAALARAGGAQRQAERSAINLAAKLSDGQQILVPLRFADGAAGGGSPASVPSASSGGGASASGGMAGGARISLSSATQDQLEQLDGIGPALAARIVEYRQAHGGFRSVDQLQEVSGIGDKRFQALRARVQP
jgi:competence protein ComEA